jgi:drug/metabolite transporter (DMT)-like permease
MFDAVTFGAGGATCLVLGMWFVWRQRRRNAGALAGWGVLALGVGQLIRAAGSLTGDRQPLGVVLAICCAVISVVGYILMARGGASFRNRRGGRKRRKLPPIRP